MDRRHLLRVGAAAAAAPLLTSVRAAVPRAGDPFIGSARAPVTATVWFDFQCPYCKLLWRDAIPKLNDRYVRAGDVKLGLSDFAFLGKDSLTAAVIGRAVWHQFPDAYLAWTNAMFAAQDGENSGFGDQDSVGRLTMAQPKIDARAFAVDFNANAMRYYGQVRADYDAATKAGVRGTPALRIGGELSQGYVPFDEIAARLDTALKRVR